MICPSDLSLTLSTLSPVSSPSDGAADLSTDCRRIADAARAASRQLAVLDGAVKDRWLIQSANDLIAQRSAILSANLRDLDAAEANQLTEAAIDRLRLTEDRIESIAGALRQIAAMNDPIGEVLEGFQRPGGLRIEKRRVPIGVVFFIYESRPNVTADAAAICVKSGNAVILRGGKEARHSSAAIVEVLRWAGVRCGLPSGAVQLVATLDRAAVGHFLKMNDAIDVAIPRGGGGLIRRVVAEATMPVIKHYDGNCHVYVDASANIAMAVDIVENAKCQRMGVCNAAESLLVHRDIAGKALPAIAERLQHRGVELRTDGAASALCQPSVPIQPADLDAEYLGPILSICVVDSLDAAIDHINAHGSHHTDAIVTSDLQSAERFTAGVDSSAVMVNASTRFNDGGMFGLGAEIGISTDKIHARGPCGIRELTTYKYIVRGDGQIR